MSHIATALLSALLFGASTPMSKLLLEDLAPFQLAGCLYLGAAAGLLAFVRPGRGRDLRPGRGLDLKNSTCLAGSVIFGGILGPVAVLYGLSMASAASVSLWLNLELAATAILGVILFRDYLGRAGWVGTCGTLAAALLLTWQEGDTGIAALGFLAFAGFCWGMDNHLTALIDRLSPAQSTCFKGIAAGLTNTLISAVSEPFSLNLPVLGAALVVGALAYGASICLYILSAQNLGATRSQMVFSAAPFFGSILSLVILGESLSALQMVAALLLIGSLVILFRDRHAHFHVHESMRHTHQHSHGDGHHDHPHPEGSPGENHSHWHSHEGGAHSHPHWPDLHHRHRH